MISFKANFKSDYNKILKSDEKKTKFKPRTNGEVRVNYIVNSERTRTTRDRFVKVVLPK